MLTLSIRTLALTLALAGCPSAPRPEPDATGAAQPSPSDGMTGATQQGTRLYGAATSGFTGAEELVIRDQAAWQAAWARVHEGMAAPPLPAVDFARDMVVLLALGERSSGGHAVRFDSLSVSGGGATVRYTATSPGPGCMTTQAITAPIEVVRVARVAGAVRFEARTVQERC